MKFKLLTTSIDLALLGNCTTKPCRYKRCAKSNLLLSGTNQSVVQNKSTGSYDNPIIIKFSKNNIFCGDSPFLVHVSPVYSMLIVSSGYEFVSHH